MAVMLEPVDKWRCHVEPFGFTQNRLRKTALVYSVRVDSELIRDSSPAVAGSE